MLYELLYCNNFDMYLGYGMYLKSLFTIEFVSMKIKFPEYFGNLNHAITNNYLQLWETGSFP